MVERQLAAREIDDHRVLRAMAAVPRELFVPVQDRARAYADGALAIGHGQTISQPWVVAAICQSLELDGSERVLEIGTGSGYSAAVLSHLAREVVSVERIPELIEPARRALAEAGVTNVELVEGDGSRGHEPGAPYDAIAVHAAAPDVPHSLLAQLADGGRLVAPIATDSSDLLTVFVRDGDGGFRKRVIGPCRFVPLIGAEGFEQG